jgi:hypothetical protein
MDRLNSEIALISQAPQPMWKFWLLWRTCCNAEAGVQRTEKLLPLETIPTGSVTLMTAIPNVRPFLFRMLGFT